MVKFILFFVLSLNILEASSFRSTEKPPFSLAVGVKTIEYQDTTRNRPVVIEMWYPLDQNKEGKEPSRDEALATSSSPFPLIVLSHGHRSSRLSQSWLAVQFARRGYIVASVEHEGHSKETFNPMKCLKFWDRMKDVSFALDQLLHHFSTVIDKKKIGFIGYSMGGMTGLGLAGAQAKNIKEIATRAFDDSENYKEFDLRQISQFDFSEGEKAYTEPRIKAMLLLCPANFIYTPESLKSIQIPIGLVAVFHDEVLPHTDHAYPLICHVVPRMIKVIRKKVAHSFLSSYKVHEEEPILKDVASFSFSFFKTHL